MKREIVLRLLPLIALLAFLAFVSYQESIFNARMNEDIGTMATRLATGGATAGEIKALSGGLLSIKANIASFVRLVAVAAACLVFATVSPLTFSTRADKQD